MKRNKIIKDSLAIGKISIVNSVMASAVAGSGGDTSGIAAFSQFTPTFATLAGAKHTIKMAKELNRVRRR